MAANVSTWKDKVEEIRKELASRGIEVVLAESLSLILIDLVAVAGNILVLVVICKTPSLQSKTNFYVLSLALSDLLTSLFVIPFTTGTLIKGGWFFGHLLCETQGLLFMLLGFASLHTMTLIAANRYFCVVKPALFRRWFQKKFLIGVLVFVWVTALLTSLLPSVTGTGGFHFEPGRSSCFMYILENQQNIIFVSFCFVFYMFLPFSLMIYCYASVFRKIRHHTTNNNLHAARTNADQNAANGLQLHAQVSAEELKVTRLLFALVLGFGACWIPSVVVEMLEAVLPFGSFSRSTYMAYIYLIYLSSAINPVLYGALNRPFRRAATRLLPFCSRSNVVEVMPSRQTNT